MTTVSLITVQVANNTKYIGIYLFIFYIFSPSAPDCMCLEWFILFLCVLLQHCWGVGTPRLVCYNTFQQGATKFHHIFKSPCYRGNRLSRNDYDSCLTFMTVFIHNRRLHSYMVIVPALVLMCVCVSVCVCVYLDTNVELQLKRYLPVKS
jgi:hypothetical protein